ncbi:L-threonylcarbamoyladenylate synthase [Bacillus kwashiorkori]|uniref:L-threonylcarbamoyladenylate synthase n=1 Tax=Bacillus kwashiorkori TaxID=1522318 RepID=UPI0007802AB9|nr:L-threonylcarbamoyladenylate synthase [Bacillus kwashiorkori]
MNTKVWVVDKSVNKSHIYPQVKEAAEVLKQNELVAFPTETVYGLGANSTSDEAVKKIYEAKGRPSDNPLIIHISDIAEVEKFVTHIPETAKKLMETFWPGPLTIVLTKKSGVLSKVATANLSTVAIRMPEHPIALALIEASGLPIAAPSANISGKPSPTKFSHVEHDLTGKIAGIINGGDTGVGVESTVIDCTSEIPTILRPGGISKEAIEAIIGAVDVDQAVKQAVINPKSPGMKYKHYAPSATMYLVNGSKNYIQHLISQYQSEGKKVGVLTTEENASFYHADIINVCGKRSDLSTVAQRLYDTLRLFDQQHVDIILSEVFPPQGIGSAIMNRLMKAANHQIMTEK